jgi:hypothetical protein
MAFKLKLKNVSASGEKASPFKINNALVYGAGDAAKKFVNVEDAYAAGTGEGVKEGRGGTDLLTKNKGKGGAETCEDKFDVSSPEFEACMETKKENNEDTTPEVKVEDIDSTDSTEEIVDAG